MEFETLANSFETLANSFETLANSFETLANSFETLANYFETLASLPINSHFWQTLQGFQSSISTHTQRGKKAPIFRGKGPFAKFSKETSKFVKEKAKICEVRKFWDGFCEVHKL
jgi:uncharacterized phage infection (PIP) family protein YhgE